MAQLASRCHRAYMSSRVHHARHLRPNTTCHAQRRGRDGGGVLRDALSMGRSGLLPKRLLSADGVGNFPVGGSRGIDQDVAGNLREPAAGSRALPKRTVFTVRVKTSQERNSDLSSDYSGIWLCLIGKDGASFLRRLAPLVDASDLQQELENICEIEDWEAVGANCHSSSLGGAMPSGLKKRFMEGSIDEESFLGPELGPLGAIIVGPEEGTWRLHELTVTSSRSGQTDRFICRERMGDGIPERSAVFLTPIPADAVVYGSGESAVVLSKEEARKVYQAGMQDYSNMKHQLTLTNLVLVCSGGSIAALVGGADAALPFMSGGALGLLYQVSLHSAADSLPSPMPMNYDENPMNRNIYRDTLAAVAQSLTSKPLGRLMISSLLIYLCYKGAENMSGSDTAHIMGAIATMLSGFLMYKVSIIAVTLGHGRQVDAGAAETENAGKNK